MVVVGGLTRVNREVLQPQLSNQMYTSNLFYNIYPDMFIAYSIFLVFIQIKEISCKDQGEAVSFNLAVLMQTNISQRPKTLDFRLLLCYYVATLWSVFHVPVLEQMPANAMVVGLSPFKTNCLRFWSVSKHHYEVYITTYHAGISTLPEEVMYGGKINCHFIFTLINDIHLHERTYRHLV